MATLLGNIGPLSESSLVRTSVCLCLFNCVAFLYCFNIFIVILVFVIYWFHHVGYLDFDCKLSHPAKKQPAS